MKKFFVIIEAFDEGGNAIYNFIMSFSHRKKVLSF
jgi:hypothetical protein